MYKHPAKLYLLRDILLVGTVLKAAVTFEEAKRFLLVVKSVSSTLEPGSRSSSNP